MPDANGTTPGDDAVYASPRFVTSPGGCYFYHTMDLPGHGLVEGEWDLRGREADYLGGIPLQGKRVLEVGPASGWLCFHMEGQGAEVVAFDLSESVPWDVVPYWDGDRPRPRPDFRHHLRQLHDGYWFAHRAFRSRARVVYGTVYDVPEAVGPVDVATFGSVLLHLANPFQALASAARLAREAVVVTDELRDWPNARQVLGDGPALRAVRDAADRNRPAGALARLLRPARRALRGCLRRLGDRLSPPRPQMLPCLLFLPDHRTGWPIDTWWYFTPLVLQRFLGVLGFPDSDVTYHRQRFRGREMPMYTVVARRPRPAASAGHGLRKSA